MVKTEIEKSYREVVDFFCLRFVKIFSTMLNGILIVHVNFIKMNLQIVLHENDINSQLVTNQD